MSANFVKTEIMLVDIAEYSDIICISEQSRVYRRSMHE